MQKVKMCVKANVEERMERLKGQLAQNGADWIAVVDDLWAHLHRSILTVASLLVYLNQGERQSFQQSLLMSRATVAEYALQEVKALLQQQETEAGSIRRVVLLLPFHASCTPSLPMSATRCERYSWIA